MALVIRKRKRNGFNGNGNGNGRLRLPTGGVRKKRFVPGFSRTAGFYGRFSRTPRNPHPERKFHDLDINDATIASGGTITQVSCNIIPQGVTEIQRIGRKCTINTILWRYELLLAAGTTSNATDVVRIILYLDKQTNGATAAVTDILESDDFQSFNNLANSARFDILLDKTIAMNAIGLAGDGTTIDSPAHIAQFTFFKKCNIAIEFSATTGAIGEQRTNNIGLLLLSRSGLVSFGSKMRLRFTDA